MRFTKYAHFYYYYFFNYKRIQILNIKEFMNKTLRLYFRISEIFVLFKHCLLVIQTSIFQARTLCYITVSQTLFTMGLNFGHFFNY